jgi:hypothetical protein
MKQLNLKIFWLLSLSLFICLSAVEAQNDSRAECFPFERLSAEQRKRGEELLLKALDNEALYTIVGGLKPMSSGFQSFQLQISLPRIEFAEAEKVVRELEARKGEELSADDKRRLTQAKQAVERKQTLDRINDTRVIFEQWKCGEEIFADVQHFSEVYEGRRHLDAVVFSRPRLRQMLAEKTDFFSRWGITANSHPLQVLYAVEVDKTNARFGGYGYLFGYPDYAVRFFALASDEQNFTGKFVERDFYSIPTFERETNGFVYATPKGHTENETDKALRARSMEIFTAYKKRRAEYIGEGKKGVVEMLRDWFCEANKCSPSNAKLN